MTQINFSPDFIKNYEGTPEELTSILNKLRELIKSGEDFDNFASSILFNDTSYDKILTIKI